MVCVCDGVALSHVKHRSVLVSPCCLVCSGFVACLVPSLVGCGSVELGG